MTASASYTQIAFGCFLIAASAVLFVWLAYDFVKLFIRLSRESESQLGSDVPTDGDAAGQSVHD